MIPSNHIQQQKVRMFFKAIILVLFLQFTVLLPLHGMDTTNYVSEIKISNSFPLAEKENRASLWISDFDFEGVKIAIKNLSTDIGKVTGKEPKIVYSQPLQEDYVVIAGTIGHNPVIDQLIRQKKLNGAKISGKWETYLITVVDNPIKGIGKALVIAGSDRRGTIFGIYDLSKKIGVSPWNWWADVPVRNKKTLYILPGSYSDGEPAVKYRGIFINDEAPALSGWTAEKFGGFNHLFYEKVFELILRLKGNFLWPAMWGSAFYDDDSLNAIRADEFGIVIGTTHHEPLMRAHDEWRRYGTGPWNYALNKENLQEFWKKGVTRMGSAERIITLGMRGDGDMPMSDESNIALLEQIVQDQRQIINESGIAGSPKDPQVWALYKEVQDYYDKGMRVPDDVTLLLCDDNWGNIRRVPPASEKGRAGGYGMYYHFDYVGGPRNYKWINTNCIDRVWEQMQLAYSYGVKQIWIVNVGDIKPMEFPISFFLDYAWAPEKWKVSDLDIFTHRWAEEQFGAEQSDEISDLIRLYSKYASRRKPELIDPGTFSLVNYSEADRILDEYHSLAARAQKVSRSLPAEYQDAFAQLILFPIQALANHTELYITVERNWLYSKQARASTNDLAGKAEELFVRDSLLTQFYNTGINHGKWNHLMDQTHIGYTYWQQPAMNALPKLERIKLTDEPTPGFAVEGSEKSWPASDSISTLPEFDAFNQQSHFIDLFNSGRGKYNFSVNAEVPWIKIDPAQGTVDKEQRIVVSVDWKQAPLGRLKVPLKIMLNQKAALVSIQVNNFKIPEQSFEGFIEGDGFVSIEAAHYSGCFNSDSISWICIPNIGRTLSGMTTTPPGSGIKIPTGNSPKLVYQIYLTDTGNFQIHSLFSPSLNFLAGPGLTFGLSIDEEPLRIINLHEGQLIPDWRNPPYWNDAVSNNIREKITDMHISKAGVHTLTYWMIDPGLVIQKFILDFGGLRPSYLGPPESFRKVFIGTDAWRNDKSKK
jgi:hypothetical protein